MAGTLFSAVYNRFLDTITDDMYMELTAEDTKKDLQRLLINAIPEFEFPRVNLYEYTISTEKIMEDEVTEDEFVIETYLTTLSTDYESGEVLIDNSNFSAELSSEEIYILALLMRYGWVQRQVTSIENTRMKYTGTDFKMTSQANHLSKLLTLLEETRRAAFHMQRLYKRRKTNSSTNMYESNWSCLRPERLSDNDAT